MPAAFKMFLSRECLASVVGIALGPVKDTVPQHSCSNREAQLGRRRAKGSLFPRLPRFLVLRVWFVAQFLRNRFSRLRSDWGLSFVVHLGLRSESCTRTLERPRPFGKHLPGISGGQLGLARGFSAADWTVSACTTDPDAFQSLATELGKEHLALTCNVTQPAEIEALAIPSRSAGRQQRCRFWLRLDQRTTERR
jgi:hypothetical protein